MERRGRYSRGYLPHIDVAGKAQFLTWCLRDALPKHVLEQIEREIAMLPAEVRVSNRWSRIEKQLDLGHGEKMFLKSFQAREVQRAIFHGHLVEYVLHGYCIMPNHVHVLCTPLDPFSLAEVVKRFKGRSAKWVNDSRGMRGSIWHPEAFDRYMRNEEHFARVLGYIEWNPVKAKLCSDPATWTYSSAFPINREKLIASGQSTEVDRTRAD